MASYSQIKPDICRFLAGNTGDLSYFDGSLERLAAKARNDPKPSAQMEARRCHGAIEAFKESFTAGRAKNYSFTQGSSSILKLEGVNISIRMDAGVVETDAKGNAHSGGCILFMSQSAAARKNIEARRRHVAAVVHWVLEGGQMEPLPKLCMSFDVFGNRLEKAPAAFTRLRADMRDSCREVASRWEEVEPPSGYDGPDWT